MKRPLQLSLAIALALGATDASALGLGAIQVQSGLNQPLVAEIPIIQSAPGEAEGLIVQLASDDDFERVGMNRASIGVPVQFSLGKNARGEPVIKVTSQEIVREPFVGLLLEANWPKGRLLREYTVLLDPPVMAPAVKGSSAVAVAAKEPERAPAQALPSTKPAEKAPPAVAAAPAKASAPVKPAAPPKSEPASRVAGGNEYGPVAAGETLGEIARATRPGEQVSINQMMLALLKSNPNAFFKDNINALKRGAVLRIPSAEEVAASGSARDAAAAVRAQIDEWRGNVSSAPTLVADTTPAATRSSAASSTVTATSDERLALVPPREGKAGQDSADRPSGGRSGDSGNTATKAELARVKEALTSKEQESGELKSRLKDLEDIKGKNEKLISLQNTELAEMREKLKQLQDQGAKAAAAAASAPKATATVAPVADATIVATPTPETPAKSSAPTAAAADGKITKDDIWGNSDGKPATPAAAPSVTTPAASPAAGDTTAPATAPPATRGDSASTTTLTTPTASTPASTLDKPVSTAAEPKKAAPKPAAKKPVPTPTKPAVSAEPWYMQPWVLGAAGIGGLLLVVAGLFGLRKRKPVPAPARTSIANAFGDSPIGSPALGDDAEAEEQALIEQVQADPSNAGAHLELLSLYYAQGASSKFEAAAEDMYAYVADPNQPDWREVRAMGEELVPHNPLFSNRNALAGDMADLDAPGSYHFDEPSTGDATGFPDFADEEAALPSQRSAHDATMATTAMPAIDVSGFDLGEVRDTQPASSDTSFSFDLPPIPAAASPRAPVSVDLDLEAPGHAADVSDEEFFAGEDAIGTKLDLAKAYLDMGDPEGARSMLEEVLAEGGPAQQDEARRLISELG
ncbi:MAG: FimV/HubP family polar landmark protein [Dokdonella sp.]|uniref:FimV/HubP family polar landmark protein n=1 Tax=Dokdonella sp. TaxID=2291710 RepID=UPI003BAF5C95